MPQEGNRMLKSFKQVRLTSFNHHGTHLCLRLRVHFLLSEQVEVGRHDDLRSLVWSVGKRESWLETYSIRILFFFFF